MAQFSDLGPRYVALLTLTLRSFLGIHEQYWIKAMISTLARGDAWILVVATTEQRGGSATNLPRSRLRTTISLFWTGEGWTSEAAEAKSFASQNEALEYRCKNREQMESTL